MKGSAPNWSRTGSQSTLNRNERPNLRRLLDDESVMTIVMPASVSTAPAANSAVSERNSRSPTLTSRRRNGPSDPRQERLAARLEPLQLGLDLRHHVGGQRRVEERRAELLPV